MAARAAIRLLGLLHLGLLGLGRGRLSRGRLSIELRGDVGSLFCLSDLRGLRGLLGLPRTLGLLRLLGALFALGEFHSDRTVVFGDAHPRELLEQLREQVRAVAAHVEIGVALLQAAADLAQAGGLAVVLVVGDDVHHGLLHGVLRHRVAAAALLVALVLHKQLERGEHVAGAPEGRGGLLLPHADDHAPALAQTAGQAREVRVAGHEAEAIDVVGVEDVHGVDDHGGIRGILALGVAELLDGRDGVLQQRVLPFRVQGERPVAVDALDSDGAILRQLVQDRLQVARRHVVRVDEQREAAVGRLSGCL